MLRHPGLSPRHMRCTKEASPNILDTLRACHLAKITLGGPMRSIHRDSPRCQAKLLLQILNLPWPMSCCPVHSLALGRPLEH